VDEVDVADQPRPVNELAMDLLVRVGKRGSRGDPAGLAVGQLIAAAAMDSADGVNSQVMERSVMRLRVVHDAIGAVFVRVGLAHDADHGDVGNRVGIMVEAHSRTLGGVV
jgi:hypothetical protein